MVRSLSDRLRRAEVLLLGSGAIATSVLLLANAGEDLRHFIDGRTSGGHVAIYGLKLLLMEAALLAPFLVLALLSRSLLRETTRHRYRWAGVGISLAASVGVVAMLVSGLIPVDLGGDGHPAGPRGARPRVLERLCAAVWRADLAGPARPPGSLHGSAGRTLQPSSHRLTASGASRPPRPGPSTQAPSSIENWAPWAAQTSFPPCIRNFPGA